VTRPSIRIPERGGTPIPGLGVDVLQFDNPDATAWPAPGGGYTIDVRHGPVFLRRTPGVSRPPAEAGR
jgi:hypothetical protein